VTERWHVYLTIFSDICTMPR